MLQDTRAIKYNCFFYGFYQRAISNIEARLQGVVVGVGAAPSLPLAVEGQARRLIAEAVSHKNLGRMYIWWMPWF